MKTVIFYKDDRRHSVSAKQFKRHHEPDTTRLFNPSVGALDHTYWRTKKADKPVSVSAII